MAYFSDAEMLYKCLGTLFDRVARDADLGPKIATAGMVIRFVYHEPEAQITVDARTPPPDPVSHFVNHYGPCDLQPDVLMTMKADIGHNFWLGKVNLITALTRRQIVATGPIPKILKLLPIIKPTYKIYPAILTELGFSDQAV